MTKIYAKRQGNYCELVAEGHATGSVTVCAAVSGLLYALAGYAVNAEKAERVRITKLHIKDAMVDIRGIGFRDAWEMAVIGLQQIEKLYPAFISVTVEIL